MSLITRHVDQDGSADEPLRIGGDASVLAGIIVLDSVKNERSVDVFDVWRPDQQRLQAFLHPLDDGSWIALSFAQNLADCAKLQTLGHRRHSKL